MQDTIIVRGARLHNLNNVDLEIPKNKLVVFTGLSGSGKSTLAFDTLYAVLPGKARTVPGTEGVFRRRDHQPQTSLYQG